MNETKKESIKNTAYEIMRYVDKKYAIDIDPFAIVEIINYEMGFLHDALEETLKKYE